MVTWGTANGFLGWQLSPRWWLVWVGPFVLDVYLHKPHLYFHCQGCCWFSLTLGWVTISVTR